jgi:hypothetical protein
MSDLVQSTIAQLLFIYCSRGRDFDTRTVQIFVCINMSVLYWVWMFSMLFIRYLESITQHRSANFGLDNRECVENIFII